MVLKVLIIGVILIALAIFVICVFVLSKDVGVTEEVEKDHWDLDLRKRPINIGEFSSYITKDGEFRLAGLLCDAGAPIVSSSNEFRICLPQRDTYLFFGVNKTKKGARVVDIEYYEGDLQKASHWRKSLLWEDEAYPFSDDYSILYITHCADILMPRDLIISRSAAETTYDAITTQKASGD